MRIHWQLVVGHQATGNLLTDRTLPEVAGDQQLAGLPSETRSPRQLVEADHHTGEQLADEDYCLTSLSQNLLVSPSKTLATKDQNTASWLIAVRTLAGRCPRDQLIPSSPSPNIYLSHLHFSNS